MSQLKKVQLFILFEPLQKNKELEERTGKNKGNLGTIRISTTELQLAIYMYDNIYI
jgi:hypothetical protein